jgi:hypothetical protein
VLIFEATKEGEMIMNTWAYGRGSGWWEPPYPRYWQGRQVHSFYLDMWLGMKDKVLEGLEKVVLDMQEEGRWPERIVISGHSMGGGMSA